MASSGFNVQRGLLRSLLGQDDPQNRFQAQVVRAVIEEALESYDEHLGNLEDAVRALESRPEKDSTAQFFRVAFNLRKDLALIHADLWRFKEMLAHLGDEENRRHPVFVPDATAIARLMDEVSYLHTTSGNLRDNVQSLIELHLNVVSFEISKFMRILATVSVLGLIPAATTGFLGMNLVGGAWHIRAEQVAFLISMGMLACLYLFYVKGWLR